MINQEDDKSRFWMTPLMVAVKEGPISEIESLLRAGTDVNLSDYYQKTALMLAAELENGDKAVELLLEAGARLDVVDRLHKSPLMHAIRCKRMAAVKCMLRAGADVNWPNAGPSSPLIEACEQSTPEILHLLLEAGADVNQPDSTSRRPIIAAALKRNTEMISMLVRAGADVNVRINDSGATALMGCAMAIEYSSEDTEQYLQCAKLLIDAGANLDIKHLSKGHTSLTFAVICGKYEMAELLVKSGADVNLTSDSGLSPLRCAVQVSEMGVIKTLLEAGATASMELHMAIERKPPTSVQFLIQHGVMPTLLHPSELRLGIEAPCLSPLAVALLFNRLDIVKYFLHIRYLTTFDIYTLPHLTDLHFRHLRRRLNQQQSEEQTVNLLSRPWTLVTLSFVVVSSALGYGQGRETRVKAAGLPRVFQDKLMFKSKEVDTPVEMWSSLEWSL